MGLGIILATPEIAITPDESKALAKATANVAQYYDVTAAPETMAWINLAAVMAGVYGSKAFAIYGRKKREKKEAPAASTQPGANVFPFVNPGFPNAS